MSYTVSGTATSGRDFTALGGSVTLATADVTVAAATDTIYDPDETVVVTVASGTGYTVGTASSDTVNIGDSTQLTFTLGSYVGAVKYEIPWGSVDPDAATQSLTPSVFNLSIGGQSFVYGVANYTTAPALLFEHGDLVGVTFVLDLTGTGSTFASISVSGVATGVDAATNVLSAPVQDKQAASIAVDFSSITIPQGATEVSFRVTVAGNVQKSAVVEIQPGATKEQVRDLFQTALTGLVLTPLRVAQPGLASKARHPPN